MVEEIRSKWCDDLENLLECPICFKRPDKWIYQCVQGHHVCQVCKPQLPRCPMCTQNWSPTRNLLAEHLCTMLDEIKISLIDPENEINKLLIPETVSTGSQTSYAGENEAAAFPSRNIQTPTRARTPVRAETPQALPSKRPVDAHSGTYPCPISSCASVRYYDGMLKHLIMDHKKQYSELPSKQSVFEHTWLFRCEPEMNLDRAFLVTDMGTFVLKVATDIFENLTAVVVMIHNGFIAKHHTYQIEINCCSEHDGAVHTDEVCSCRSPSKSIVEKSLHVPRSEIARMLKCDSGIRDLKCMVLLGKKPIIPDDNYKKKPYKTKFQK